MKVRYDTGRSETERVRIELEPAEAAALADLYYGVFDDNRDDPIATGLRKIAREWGMDCRDTEQLSAKGPE